MEIFRGLPRGTFVIGLAGRIIEDLEAIGLSINGYCAELSRQVFHLF
jgi:hypothetical protein